MPTFPDLSYDFYEDFEESVLTDTTVRSMTTGGRPLDRPGTDPILYQYRYTQRFVTETDRTSLKTFQDTTVCIGGNDFTWTDPRFELKHNNMRFAAPLRFMQDVAPNHFRVDIHVKEDPSY